MRGLILVALLVATPAIANGYGSGYATSLPDAQMKWLCVEALKREIAGGPPAPAACGSSYPTTYPRAEITPPPTPAMPTITRCGWVGQFWQCRSW